MSKTDLANRFADLIIMYLNAIRFMDDAQKLTRQGEFISFSGRQSLNDMIESIASVLYQDIGTLFIACSQFIATMKKRDASYSTKFPASAPKEALKLLNKFYNHFLSIAKGYDIGIAEQHFKLESDTETATSQLCNRLITGVISRHPELITKSLNSLMKVLPKQPRKATKTAEPAKESPYLEQHLAACEGLPFSKPAPTSEQDRNIGTTTGSPGSY